MRALVQRHSEKAQDRRSEAPRPSRLGTLLGGAPSVRAQMALAETLHARPAVQAASRLSAAMSQSAAPVQRTKNDAKAFITEHNLNINANGFEMDDVVKYAKSRGPRFQELLARWNKGGGPKIVDDMLKPKREKGAAKTRVVEQEDEDSDEDDEEEEDSYAHFTSGENADIEFNGGGALVNPETGKTASATKRKAIYRGLGIGEHLLRGHFLDEETLKSQNAAESADGASGNFSWASDKAALDTVEAGRRDYEDKKASTKKIDVAIAEDAGFGFVTGTDGQRYKVFPRKARVIRKAKGDFKTAYGVTEEKDPAKFDAAYHRTEAVA